MSQTTLMEKFRCLNTSLTQTNELNGQTVKLHSKWQRFRERSDRAPHFNDLYENDKELFEFLRSLWVARNFGWISDVVEQKLLIEFGAERILKLKQEQEQ